MYLHPHQMSHCLGDADIMEMVEKAQLKLIYIDGFPKIFTRCQKFAHIESINTTFSADEEVGRAYAPRQRDFQVATSACC